MAVVVAATSTIAGSDFGGAVPGTSEFPTPKIKGIALLLLFTRKTLAALPPAPPPPAYKSTPCNARLAAR